MTLDQFFFTRSVQKLTNAFIRLQVSNVQLLYVMTTEQTIWPAISSLIEKDTLTNNPNGYMRVEMVYINLTNELFYHLHHACHWLQCVSGRMKLAARVKYNFVCCPCGE